MLCRKRASRKMQADAQKQPRIIRNSDQNTPLNLPAGQQDDLASRPDPSKAASAHSSAAQPQFLRTALMQTESVSKRQLPWHPVTMPTSAAALSSQAPIKGNTFVSVGSQQDADPGTAMHGQLLTEHIVPDAEHEKGTARGAGDQVQSISATSPTGSMRSEGNRKNCSAQQSVRGSVSASEQTGAESAETLVAVQQRSDGGACSELCSSSRSVDRASSSQQSQRTRGSKTSLAAEALASTSAAGQQALDSSSSNGRADSASHHGLASSSSAKAWNDDVSTSQDSASASAPGLQRGRNLQQGACEDSAKSKPAQARPKAATGRASKSVKAKGPTSEVSSCCFAVVAGCFSENPTPGKGTCAE